MVGTRKTCINSDTLKTKDSKDDLLTEFQKEPRMSGSFFDLKCKTLQMRELEIEECQLYDVLHASRALD